MAKKAKKRTTAERRAAAKAAWARRKAGAGIVPGTPETAGPLSYAPLRRELDEAFRQSSEGKGKERHANGRPFDRQPIMELGRLYGPGFAAGQAAKKVQEALSMLDRGKFTKEQAMAEVHGGIVYLAAVASLIRGD